jgi:hypothetical protein
LGEAAAGIYERPGVHLAVFDQIDQRGGEIAARDAAGYLRISLLRSLVRQFDLAEQPIRRDVETVPPLLRTELKKYSGAPEPPECGLAIPRLFSVMRS